MTLRKSVSDNEKVKRDSEWHNVDKKICRSLYLWKNLDQWLVCVTLCVYFEH